jgi:peptide-methionine (S)-S-oxide reductase
MIKRTLSVLVLALAAWGSATAQGVATAKQDMAKGTGKMGLETVTLGGGCFWCMEAIFHELKGVEKVESGYAGGTVANPTYKQVCTGTTGHAEVVQVTFDPKVLPLKTLLEVFFALHDPTTLNRQGADSGTQYRSVVFYRTPEQKSVVESEIKDLQAKKAYADPIVTQVVPFSAFYKAEDYHQDYYEDNINQPYCQLVISPKLAKFRKLFKDMAK